MYRIMIVDDEENILKTLKRLLMTMPCYHEGVAYRLEVETDTSPLAALERIRTTPYALVIADYRMPELDGTAFLKQVRELQPDSVRMILSGYPDLNGLIDAINEAQIARFIAKPWNDYELITSIGQALAYRAMQLENLRLANERRRDSGALVPPPAAVETPPGAPKDRHWGPDGSAVYDDASNWFG